MACLDSYKNLKDEVACTWLRNCCHPISKLHRVLERIAINYTKVIPLRQIEKCHSVNEAFRLLEKWKLLSPERPNVILELCIELNGPVEMVRSRVELALSNYLQVAPCICNAQEMNQNNIPHNNVVHNLTNHVTSRYFRVYDYLSDNIGIRWIDLGRQLPAMRNRTEEIKSDPLLNRQKDKIIALLEEFEALHGSSSSTFEILLGTMKKLELNKQRKYILNNLLA